MKIGIDEKKIMSIIRDSKTYTYTHTHFTKGALQ